MKETGGKKKRRGEEDYDGEDIDKYLGLKEGKSSKKFRRWDHIIANEWINAADEWIKWSHEKLIDWDVMQLVRCIQILREFLH